MDSKKINDIISSIKIGGKVMKIDHTYAIYFSPTYTSKKSAVSIARGLEGELTEIDLTLEKAIPKMTFSRHDVVVFGFPVYSGRILHEALNRLKIFKGDHTSCVITVTYGNRHYDDALLELFNIVKEKGFIPIAGAALIGEHTYGHIQVGRPNRDDLYRDELFGSLVRLKLRDDNFSFVSVPGKYPYREGGMGGIYRPETNELCNQCGICVNMCPVDAISKNNCKTISDKCIACFRCIRICPMHAKNMDNNKKYQEFAEVFSEKLAVPKENEYFI